MLILAVIKLLETDVLLLRVREHCPLIPFTRQYGLEGSSKVRMGLNWRSIHPSSNE